MRAEAATSQSEGVLPPVPAFAKQRLQRPKRDGEKALKAQMSEKTCKGIPGPSNLVPFCVC